MPLALNQSMQPPQVEPIAGFINRKDCFAEIAQLATLSTPERPLAVIWIALDRFKQVNESFGHRGGDAVIAQLSQRLRSRTGTRGTWCRMAGDEFVCLVSTYNFDQIQQLAADLLHEIEIPLPIGGLLLHPSASLGIAILEESERPSLCLQRADRAMNTSKRAGGGRIITSGSEPMPGRLGVLLARHELELESKLHLALNHGGLNLHYQPCVDADGQIVSVEALMRCPAHNLSPGEFIPIAEKTGLIIRLGEWSLLEGARFAKHLSSLRQPTVVSINVSRAQFVTPNFSQTLHAALLCADVDPELIELELTESLFMDNCKLVQTNLRAVLDTGVKIAIDDFGTGYSCLATLKDITASKLKLDRAFVVALPQDRRAFAVVKAIAQLGNDLGMRVVAEGVENQQQLDTLRDAGVHAIQGYFYARPMPENELMAWLQQQKKTT